MNNKILNFGNNAYGIGLFLVACSMALSKFGMSIGQFFILGGWLLSGDFHQKWLRLKENKIVVLLLTALFGAHLIGLLSTSDFDYAFRDIRIKLPLLILPILIFSMPPLSESKKTLLFRFFIFSLVVSSLISLVVYLGWSKIVVNDIRDISPFISHIRLALLICVGIVLLIDDFITSKRILNLFLIGWFLAFLILLQSLTGIIILLLLTCVYLIKLLFQKTNPLLLRLFCVSILLTMLATGGYFYKLVFIDSIVPIHVNESQLLKYTPRGNTYYSLPERQDIENGNPVWINICDKELDEAWKERTGSSVYDNNPYGYWYYYSIIRFLSSKGWNKDREAIMSLSSNEIEAIQKGCSNVEQINNNGIKTRIKNLSWEYRQYYYNGEFSGQSFTQHLAYLSIGLNIFKNNWLFGVGTGDVNEAFKNEYALHYPKLEEKWRLRTHNQYITLGIAFGVSGLLLLLAILFYPLWSSYKSCGLLFKGFILIAAVSMLSEDTLETQAGITFFVFLYCLLWRERKIKL